MNKVIVFKKNDGSCKIRYVITEDASDLEINRLAQKHLPEVQEYNQNYRVLTKDKLPNDRTFRNAWKDNNTSKIAINMVKARDIHMARIRRVRDNKLKELDIETLKGNDVRRQKQRLRDVPQNVDLSTANTPEQLKSIWPEELN